MNKNLKIFIAIILSLCISTLTVVASQNYEEIKILYRGIKILVDGNEVEFREEPFIFKNTVYVPIRFIAQSLNSSVLWNNQKNTISISTFKDFPETNPLEGERFIYGEILSIDKEKRIVHIYQHIDDNSIDEEPNLKISEDVVIILQRNDKKINLDFADLKIGDNLGMVINGEGIVRGIIIGF